MWGMLSNASLKLPITQWGSYYQPHLPNEEWTSWRSGVSCQKSNVWWEVMARTIPLLIPTSQLRMMDTWGYIARYWHRLTCIICEDVYTEIYFYIATCVDMCVCISQTWKTSKDSLDWRSAHRDGGHVCQYKERCNPKECLRVLGDWWKGGGWGCEVTAMATGSEWGLRPKAIMRKELPHSPADTVQRRDLTCPWCGRDCSCMARTPATFTHGEEVWLQRHLRRVRTMT